MAKRAAMQHMVHLAVGILLLAVLIIYSVTAWIVGGITRSRRRARLNAKYRDAVLVDRLMACRVWQGQSEELLIDSFGRPENIDVKVLKTKRKEIWKYTRTGHNRYRNRITLENGRVVGWDIK